MHGITARAALLGFAAFCAYEVVNLAAQPVDVPPPIEGVWVLNQELSDSPNEPALSGRSEERPDRGGGNGGGFRGPGGIGGGWGGFGGRSGGFGGREGRDRPSPEEMAARREAMQTAMEDLTSAPYRMTVVTADDEVVLTFGDGRVVRLIADNREHAGIAGTAMEVKRRTRWQGTQLVTQIELQSRTKLKVRRTYPCGSRCAPRWPRTHASPIRNGSGCCG